jgi:Gram-negative bacterial TonB protein C-terminal
MATKLLSFRRSAILLFGSLFMVRIARTQSTTVVNTYPDSSEGLQAQIQTVGAAINTKDAGKETDVLEAFVLPDSKWFIEEFGPGFGASLASAYQRTLAETRQSLRIVYEGNVKRGWTRPKISRYDDPEKVNSPVDRYLNCMERIVPLYETAFNGEHTGVYFSTKPGQNPTPDGGDLPGFYVHVDGRFRFIPQHVLLRLPRERPVRITLSQEIMNSKQLTELPLKYPEEALRRHISGKVSIHVVLDVNGKIKELTTLEGDPVLANPVSNALRQMLFEPTQLDGDPVEVEFDYATAFQLH